MDTPKIDVQFAEAANSTLQVITAALNGLWNIRHPKDLSDHDLEMMAKASHWVQGYSIAISEEVPKEVRVIALESMSAALEPVLKWAKETADIALMTMAVDQAIRRGKNDTATS